MLARRQIVAVMEGKTRPSSSSFSMPYIVPNNKPELDPERTYVLQVKGVTTRQCRGAGIGLVLYDPVFKLELWCGGIYAEGYRIGFEAEYSALIMGMDYVHNVLGVRRMILQSSYHAVVNQVTGEFTSNKRSLRILLHSVKTLEQNFQDFAIQHVSLSELSKAESLAHTALATRKSTRSVELNSFPLDEKDPIRESLARKSNQLQPDIRAKSVSIDPSRTYLLQFDGGARSEYGVAGAGMVIYDVERDLEVWCGWYFHDNFATNNVAEYLGLVYGLKCAKSLGIRKLAVEGDSLLIVRQMNLNYLTREESLLVLRVRAFSKQLSMLLLNRFVCCISSSALTLLVFN
jgi:ribonuclease HI